MGYYRPGFYGLDPTVLLLVAGMVLSLLASARLKRIFAIYRRIPSASHMTGAQAAQRILKMAGLSDVRVCAVSGELTDHYDPRSRTVRLSEAVYGQTSLAAVGVAAHECGHAVQHRSHYAPLRWRSAIVPIANFGSGLSWPVFVVGLVTSMRPLLYLGIGLFSAAVLFQLVTLPVELNASARALRLLTADGILTEQEVPGARKVLGAAALTYVAALASSILQLVRLLVLAGGRDRE
ncbi:MAG: zinc metallopeptidase [Lachnospiraceae bacterium]|jgi:Zn-dependent membrane protease YugP|nr:zinc metallopeptidase [Lachnospiraceae bacterium]